MPCSAPFLPRELSLCTWNSQALFGSMYSEHQRVACKTAVYRDLVLANDVTCIQETHGSRHDLDNLRKRFPSHYHYGTFCPNPNAGGLVISLSNRLASQFDDFACYDLVPGRALRVHMSSQHGCMNVIGLHIFDLTSRESLALFEYIRDVCGNINVSASFLLGDMNFCHTGDHRMSMQTGALIRDNSRLQHSFDTALAEWVELHQPQFTHRTVAEGKLVSCGRLDRVYTNIHAPLLLDMDIATDVKWDVTQSCKPSDHSPVCASVRKRRFGSGMKPRVPSWATTHAMYPVYVERLVQEHPLSEHPHDALAECKDIFRQAAVMVKRLAIVRGAGTTSEKLHWSLVALRASLVGHTHKVRDSVSAHAHLASLVDLQAGYVSDVAGLCAHIAELSRVSIKEQSDELAQVADMPEYKRQARIRSLVSRASLWGPHSKRVCISSITDEQGNPAGSAEESASRLRDHWTPVFARKPIDHEAADALLQHVRQVPGDIEWRLTLEKFGAIVAATHDTAPGPDGLPYSAWKHAGSAPLRVLYDVYLHLLDTGELPTGFNHSILTFIPKGPSPGDDNDDDLSRSPKQTRPLSLGSTDNKILAMAIAAPLQVAAQASVCKAQRGFIRGRAMLDCVYEIEAHAVVSSLLGGTRPAIITHDFSSAFPSIAHVFIFLVLTASGVPLSVIVAIRALYTDCYCWVLFSGMLFDGLEAMSGIKQGCPMSGVIYSLSLDCFVRMLIFYVPSPLGRVAAFADDITISLRDLFEGLPLTMRCFDLLEKAACLKLNLDKCVIVLLWLTDEGELRVWMVQHASGSHLFKVATRAKMLGIWIGPSADEVMWSAPLSKLAERVAFIKSSRQGLMRNILHYNVFAFSCLQFVAQCASPTKKALKAEKHARQMLTLAPWNALQHELLSQLKVIGLPGECHDLEHVALAAKFRAATFSYVFSDCVEEIEAARESDDAVLMPRLDLWHRSCILATIQSARQRVLSLPDLRVPFIAEGVQGFQHAVMIQVSQHVHRRPVSTLLETRAHKWGDGHAIQTSNLCEPLLGASKKLPPHVTVGYLKTVCNAWNTSRRYRSDAKQCRFGCGMPAGDSLRHYLACPATLHMVFHSFPSLMSTCEPQRPLVSLLGLATSMDHLAMSRHMLLIEAMRSVHETLRTTGQYCSGPAELADRVRTRLRAPATESRWARSRCVELLAR